MKRVFLDQLAENEAEGLSGARAPSPYCFMIPGRGKPNTTSNHEVAES